MVQITVNGSVEEIDADSGTPLIHILRNHLGLNSPRLGCGLEQCGACRIQVDQKLVYSCSTSLGEVNGKSITTAEALVQDGALHSVQQALLECNAGQCGYCLSGIVMAATDLLKHNPSPSRVDIQEALSPHLCRCGSHNRIIKAIQLAAEEHHHA